MAGKMSHKGQSKTERVMNQELKDVQNISVNELLKRLSWAGVSVPAPNWEVNDLKNELTNLTPEELLKLRATASLLENYHNRVLEYLQSILELVHENGYLAPIRIK